MDEGTQIIVTKVVDMLDSLAVQLGVAKEVIFPWYVKQQALLAYTHLSMIVIFFVLGVILMPIGWITGKKVNAEYKAEHSKEPDFTRWDFILILGAISFLGALLCAIGGGPSIVSRLYNPEYKALQDLLYQLR